MKSLFTSACVALFVLSAQPVFAVQVVSSSGKTDCKSKSQEGLFANTNPRAKVRSSKSAPDRIAQKSRAGRR